MQLSWHQKIVNKYSSLWSCVLNAAKGPTCRQQWLLSRPQQCLPPVPLSTLTQTGSPLLCCADTPPKHPINCKHSPAPALPTVSPSEIALHIILEIPPTAIASLRLTTVSRRTAPLCTAAGPGRQPAHHHGIAGFSALYVIPCGCAITPLYVNVACLTW